MVCILIALHNELRFSPSIQNPLLEEKADQKHNLVVHQMQSIAYVVQSSKQVSKTKHNFEILFSQLIDVSIKSILEIFFY